jgi:alanine-glyoxylate transaminase/serine-glyoxylate transaminase/serine-pyruvate transaminase
MLVVPLSDRVLMGPGPCNPYPEVNQALTRPLLGHLDPEFLALLDETNERLRRVFRTTNPLTFPVSGTGSAGMEAAFVNVVRPGDVVVVGVNGVFGERMCDVAGRAGAEVVRVEADWGKALDPQALLDAHPAPAVIAAVHAETSTGVRNDVACLGQALRHQDAEALVLLDCVTSLGGIPVEIDAWGADLAYSGTQKCLGVPPGLAPFTAGPRALDRLIERPQSWYLDLNMLARYVTGEGARAYHHTAPIAMIFALHAGLGAVLDEGLEASWARHQACGDALQAGLVERGSTAMAPRSRIPTASTTAAARSRGEADTP